MAKSQRSGFLQEPRARDDLGPGTSYDRHFRWLTLGSRASRHEQESR